LKNEKSVCFSNSGIADNVEFHVAYTLSGRLGESRQPQKGNGPTGQKGAIAQAVVLRIHDEEDGADGPPGKGEPFP